MRMLRWMGVLTVAAGLALGACGGGEDEVRPETGNDNDAVVGSNDGVSPTTGETNGTGSAPGSQSLGSPTAQEQTTTINDTTPHRPGSPSAP